MAHINTFCVDTQGVGHTTRTWRVWAPPGHTAGMPKGKSTTRATTTESRLKKTSEGVLAGQRIRAAREAKNLSQDALSAATGGKLGGRRIGNWEQGTREVGILEARILATALEEPAAYLMGLVDDVDRELLKLPLEVKKHLLQAVRGLEDRIGSGPRTARDKTQQQNAASEDRPIAGSTSDLPARLQRA